MTAIEWENRTYGHLYNHTNFSVDNYSSPSGPVTDPVEIILWFSSFIGFCLIGALQNFSMVVVVWTNPTLRQGVGPLLIHLCLVYALLFTIHYPIYAVLTLVKHMLKWDVPRQWCPYVVMPQMMFSFVTNWTDVCLALNRLLAVCFPRSYQICYRNYKEVTIIVTLIIVWIFNFCLSFPACFGVGGIYMPSKIGSCQWTPNDRLSALVGPLGTIFPLALAGSFYVVILFKAALNRIKNRVSIQDHQNIRDMKIMKKRMAVVLVLFFSFLLYLVCYLPASIIGIYFQPLIIRTPILYLWLRTVFLGGAAVSPLVFWIMNTDYRNGLKRMVCGQTRDPKRSHNQITSSGHNGTLAGTDHQLEVKHKCTQIRKL